MFLKCIEIIQAVKNFILGKGIIKSVFQNTILESACCNTFFRMSIHRLFPINFFLYQKRKEIPVLDEVLSKNCLLSYLFQCAV